MDTIVTRLDFLKQISNDQVVDMMCNYFDQNMALYDIVHNNLDKLIIDKTIDPVRHAIIFNIKISDLNLNINELIKATDYQTVYYGRLFNITMSNSENEIDIRIEEAVV